MRLTCTRGRVSLKWKTLVKSNLHLFSFPPLTNADILSYLTKHECGSDELSSIFEYIPYTVIHQSAYVIEKYFISLPYTYYIFIDIGKQKKKREIFIIVITLCELKFQSCAALINILSESNLVFMKHSDQILYHWPLGLSCYKETDKYGSSVLDSDYTQLFLKFLEKCYQNFSQLSVFMIKDGCNKESHLI